MIKNNPTQVITVQPAQLIRAYLQVKPAASPADVVQWLRGFGVELSVEVAGALLAAIKTG
jgi:hypothetical protein